jgi:hypothetical protein
MAQRGGVVKKIERLRWVEKVFGQSFVLKYFYCLTWEDVEAAIGFFEKSSKTWGMRTDLVDCWSHCMAGHKLPFLLHGTRKEAKKIWCQYGSSLYYLVSLNLPLVKLHGVAYLVDDEHIYVEINDKEETISQRMMYEHPGNLRSFGIGPSSYIFYPPATEKHPSGALYRCYHPEEVMILSLDLLYRQIVAAKVEETTFSVTPQRQVVVW